MSLGQEDDPSIITAFASGTTGAGNVGCCVLECILAETDFEEAAKRLESHFDFNERRLAHFQPSRRTLWPVLDVFVEELALIVTSNEVLGAIPKDLTPERKWVFFS